MRTAIMQPHFFPWSGYFNLINKVDYFVFLDDAQFSKQSWQSRNIIFINDNKKWISIPLENSTISLKINEKKISNKYDWKKKISKTIRQFFLKHEYFNDLEELLIYFESLDEIYLSDFNIKIINFILDKMKINTKIFTSSKFNLKLKRTEKIVKILEKLKSTDYLAVKGSQQYLVEDKFSELTKINLSYNDFKCKEYEQYNSKKFISNLSIIDVVANLGWEKTYKYINN